MRLRERVTRQGEPYYEVRTGPARLYLNDLGDIMQVLDGYGGHAPVIVVRGGRAEVSSALELSRYPSLTRGLWLSTPDDKIVVSLQRNLSYVETTDNEPGTAQAALEIARIIEGRRHYLPLLSDPMRWVSALLGPVWFGGMGVAAMIFDYDLTVLAVPGYVWLPAVAVLSSATELGRSIRRHGGGVRIVPAARP
ncbi:MAG: hypothetical protein ACRDPK_04385 [Carbonactinosporaceae bacterium]